MSKPKLDLRQTYLLCQESRRISEDAQRKASVNHEQETSSVQHESTNPEQESTNTKQDSDFEITIKQESLEPQDSSTMSTFASVWVKVEQEEDSTPTVCEPEDQSDNDTNDTSTRAKKLPRVEDSQVAEPIEKKPRLETIIAVERMSAQGELIDAISSILGTPAVQPTAQLEDSVKREEDTPRVEYNEAQANNSDNTVKKKQPSSNSDNTVKNKRPRRKSRKIDRKKTRPSPNSANIVRNKEKTSENSKQNIGKSKQRSSPNSDTRNIVKNKRLSTSSDNIDKNKRLLPNSEGIVKTKQRSSITDTIVKNKGITLANSENIVKNKRTTPNSKDIIINKQRLSSNSDNIVKNKEIMLANFLNIIKNIERKSTNSEHIVKSKQIPPLNCDNIVNNKRLSPSFDNIIKNKRTSPNSENIFKTNRRSSNSEDIGKDKQRPDSNDIVNIGSEEEYDSENDERTDFFVPRYLRPLFATYDNRIEPKPPPPQIENNLNGNSPTADNIHWRPNTLVSSKKRQESFKSLEGPTKPLLNPHEAFTAIWDKPIMDLIAEETNRYAEETLLKLSASKNQLPASSRLKQWVPTNADELYSYFGVLLAMGHCQKSDIKEFWFGDGINETPNYSKTLAFDRYELLNQFLHFTNNDIITTSDRSQAKIMKIKPIAEYINEKFQSLYSLKQNIAVEESLTQTVAIKQNVKNTDKTEQNRHRLRSYEVCDAKSGYLWRFEIHGSEETTSENSQLRKQEIVLSLLKGLEKKGHCVYMDDLITSPNLVRTLKSKGFDCVGQLQTKDIPKILSSNINVTEEVQACTSGDMDVLWHDKRKMAIISTYQAIIAKTNRLGVTFKPVSLCDYRACMFWLDRKDRQLAKFPVERRDCKQWYKRFFRRLLNASVLNSYILCAESNAGNANYEQFRQALFESLIAKRSSVAIEKISSSIKFSHNFLAHLPTEYKTTETPEASTRFCVICSKAANSYCPGCKVSLCAFVCHGRYHFGE